MADLAVSASERAISFGPFRLLPAQRLLLEGDKPGRLGSRALDILIVLVERPGELVGKEELMARVWRGTFVEEGNLKFRSARCGGRWGMGAAAGATSLPPRAKAIALLRPSLSQRCLGLRCRRPRRSGETIICPRG